MLNKKPRVYSAACYAEVSWTAVFVSEFGRIESRRRFCGLLAVCRLMEFDGSRRAASGMSHFGAQSQLDHDFIFWSREDSISVKMDSPAPSRGVSAD